ncbi:MAG: class I SAM-dependent methyltransferase [Mobilicoccus sp.]|nr:class I SAM-dependent methyltransferase [Mobilicoccus sp.]
MSDDGGTPDHPRLRDYVQWHQDYDDPGSALSARLRQVQRAIADWYARTPGPVRVLSSCAGQGHDLLGVLEERPADRARTSGVLIELDPTNARVARERIDALDLDLRVVEADAGVTDAYVDGVPADLVLLSGIMGNITGDDIERLIHVSRQFCVPGATVVWTRGAQEPDLGPDIRRWLGEAGFEEVSHDEGIEGTSMRVGVNRLVVEPDELVPGTAIFTFYR